MEMHRERTEVVFSGGKPWGFSIKGGTENNKSIVVSKLQSGGKGERSGLVVGDIISCVNDVNLAGMRRTQAVELIRKSGDRLILSVERSFPMNSVDRPQKVQSPPYDCYKTETHIQPATQTRGHSVADQKNLYNSDGSGSHSSGNNANSQKPAGYIFSQSNDKMPKYQHIKETIKSVVIDPKREASIGNQPDIIRDRLSDKGRRSLGLPAASVPRTTESSGNQSSVAMRQRHGNNRDTERPRSWHASKHPEIEQGMPSSAEKTQPPPFVRRKSREWLETEDLRSTINRKSSESLLSGSSSERLSTSIASNGDSVMTGHTTNTQGGRDRTSIHSNPSLMEAVENLAKSRPGSMDYDSHYSHYSATERTSQDSLDNMSQKSSCPHSDSKKSARSEPANRLRASGRYGEIWKLPQEHQRAKSFDGLSDPSPRLKEERKIGAMGQRQMGASHTDLPSRRTENSSKSPSPLKPQARVLHRGEKGKHVEAVVANMQRGNPTVQTLTNHSENKTNNNSKANEESNFNESRSILTRLQVEQRTPPSSNTKPRNLEPSKDGKLITSPTALTPKYVQSSRGLRGFYSEKDPDYPTLPSRSDEYKEKIQGMSKKVLRETSFTRKEFSPPYRNPSPQHKSFCYPLISEKSQDSHGYGLPSAGPMQSKSTSSLLEPNVSPAISIPTTHEEDPQNELSVTLSPVQSTVCHVSTSEKLQNPIGKEEVIKKPGQHIRSLSDAKEADAQQNEDSHCVHMYRGEPPPPDIINHTNIVMKSPTRRQNSDDSYMKVKTPTKVSISTAQICSTEPLPTSTAPAIEPILPTLPVPTSMPLPIPNIISSAESAKTSAASSNNTTSASSSLPLTSAHFQITAPRAILNNRMQKEGGEMNNLDDHHETEDERSARKIKLLKRITENLNSLHKERETVKIDLEDNEQVGKTVKQYVEELCTTREVERFRTFVEEIDKIVNLIFSLSGRLARVENTLATLAEGAPPDERNGLLEKKQKLSSQLEEAHLLKDNVNKRQETVCKTLSTYMSREQYGLFEHYIKMKTTLVSQQREMDDKMKLGEEQMRELYESLPGPLQDEHPQYQSFLPSNFTERNKESAQTTK